MGGYEPDPQPLVHLQNFYLGAGFNAFGIASGGGAGWALAACIMEDPAAVLLGRETILGDGRPAGYLTSGGFGPAVGAPLGYGYVRDHGGLTDEALLASTCAIVVAGETIPAQASLTPFVNPEGTPLRP